MNRNNLTVSRYLYFSRDGDELFLKSEDEDSVEEEEEEEEEEEDDDDDDDDDDRSQNSPETRDSDMVGLLLFIFDVFSLVSPFPRCKSFVDVYLVLIMITHL